MADDVTALMKLALRRSGMTARELAVKTSISEGRISDYLNGRHDPGSRQLLRILAATGHRLEIVPSLEANGLLLAQLLDLGDALSVGSRETRTKEEDLPLWRDLVALRD